MKNTEAAYQEDPYRNVEDFTRSRTQPSLESYQYSHISDLNDFIRQFQTQEVLVLLDYGAGASPYREYFPNADYRRADLSGVGDLHYIIPADSKINENDETFDMILSTQVVEHVEKPDIYFSECYRLLKKGGRLIVTTHGFWEEHGVPFDFQRWTEGGMRRDLKNAGFQQVDIYKITCGLRASLLLFSQGLYAEGPPQSSMRRLGFKSFRYLYSRILPFLHRVSDAWWPENKIVKSTAASPGPTGYVVIAAVAMK